VGVARFARPGLELGLNFPDQFVLRDGWQVKHA